MEYNIFNDGDVFFFCEVLLYFLKVSTFLMNVETIHCRKRKHN